MNGILSQNELYVLPKLPALRDENHERDNQTEEDDEGLVHRGLEPHPRDHGRVLCPNVVCDRKNHGHQKPVVSLHVRFPCPKFRLPEG